MKTYTWVVIVLLVIALGALWYWQTNAPTQQSPGTTSTTTTNSSTPPSTSQTTSDGTIAFATPSDFGLAVTKDQVPIKSYIPPCEENFNYCLYYNGSDYQGTNFESAGLSIVKRADLNTEATCLNTPPMGYDTSIKPNNTNAASGYATSVFENIGDAAAGHYASGALYRLYIASNAKCYEFLLRIGETQFANYPAGSIKEFTDADRTTLGQELTALLQSITFANGQPISWPNTK